MVVPPTSLFLATTPPMVHCLRALLCRLPSCPTMQDIISPSSAVNHLMFFYLHYSHSNLYMPSHVLFRMHYNLSSHACPLRGTSLHAPCVTTTMLPLLVSLLHASHGMLSCAAYLCTCLQAYLRVLHMCIDYLLPFYVLPQFFVVAFKSSSGVSLWQPFIDIFTLNLVYFGEFYIIIATTCSYCRSICATCYCASTNALVLLLTNLLLLSRKLVIGTVHLEGEW